LPAQAPNLGHLRVFWEAARLGGVSSAARAVHLSQPAVTQAIHAVERVIGAQLLCAAVWASLLPRPVLLPCGASSGCCCSWQ